MGGAPPVPPSFELGGSGGSPRRSATVLGVSTALGDTDGERIVVEAAAVRRERDEQSSCRRSVHPRLLKRYWRECRHSAERTNRPLPLLRSIECG